MADQQSTNQSAAEQGETPAGSDNSTAQEAVMPLAQELGPNGLPLHPPQGQEPEAVDNDFLMNTFFGDGDAEAPKTGSGQTQGSNEPAGKPEGPLARPSDAPAAKGGEGSPQSGPSPTPERPAVEQAPERGAPAQTPGQTQPSPEAPPAPQLTAEQQLALASATALREQNAELQRRLAALEKGGTQQTGQQQQQGSQAQPSDQPGGGVDQPLRLVVPPQLHEAIMSEDPATSQQAMGLLISAVAENAIKATLARVEPLIDSKLQNFNQTMAATQQVNQMEEAYYSRFPQHRNELFKTIIQSVVDEKYKAFPGAPWDDVMIDAVGSTVNEKLRGLGIDPSTLSGEQQPEAAKTNGSGGQGQQQQQPKPRQQPAPMLDASTRGTAPVDSGDFIRDTFN